MQLLTSRRLIVSQLITSRRLIVMQLITSRRLIVRQLIASRQRIVGQLITSRQPIVSQITTSRQPIVSQLITSRQRIYRQPTHNPALHLCPSLNLPCCNASLLRSTARSHRRFASYRGRQGLHIGHHTRPAVQHVLLPPQPVSDKPLYPGCVERRFH